MSVREPARARGAAIVAAMLGLVAAMIGGALELVSARGAAPGQAAMIAGGAALVGGLMAIGMRALLGRATDDRPHGRDDHDSA